MLLCRRRNQMALFNLAATDSDSACSMQTTCEDAGREERGNDDENNAKTSDPEFLALKHESRILGHLSNPLWGFSMMERVWPI